MKALTIRRLAKQAGVNLETVRLTDDQRLSGAVRPSQRGHHLEWERDAVVWGDYRIRAIPGSG
jgi:hypothetical protein